MSDNILGIAAGIAVFGLLIGSEMRYQPQTFEERVIGYFIYPGDLVTSRDMHPRDLIADRTTPDR